MRNMNCRSVRREVDELASDGLLSSSANDHLKTCAQCGTFREERFKLREMLSSLGAVEAPGDFDFRLRARLANEKSGLTQPFVMRNLTFGFRSASVATILLLIGSTLLFVSLRTPPNSSVSVNDTKPASTAVDKSPNKGQQESVPKSDTTANVILEKDPSVVVGSSPDKREESTKKRVGFRRGEVASLPGGAGVNERLKTRDLSSTQATVLRPKDATAETEFVFPIGAPRQSLKVSLDDGRGVSRTISVPSVSFGSQRVVAQGSSPLLASARSDW